MHGSDLYDNSRRNYSNIPTKEINVLWSVVSFIRGHQLKRKYHCATDLLFILFGLNCFAYLLYEQQFYLFGQIQTSQTGGQLYSDAPPYGECSLPVSFIYKIIYTSSPLLPHYHSPPIYSAPTTCVLFGQCDQTVNRLI